MAGRAHATRTGSSRRPTTGATWRAPGPRRGSSTCPAGGWWGAPRSPTGRSPCAGTPSTTTSGTPGSTATAGRRWLPWFRAIETDRDFGDAPWHGDAGPIPIGRYPRAAGIELQERFAEAALSVGHAWVDDHNAPGAVGIGPIPLNMVDGVRQTPADHYLDPALGARATCRCAPGCWSTGSCSAGGRARASRCVGPDGPETLGADAVVMALGTYATPAALLRSGVGPAGRARRATTSRWPRRVAGVGRGMQDHPKVSYRFDLGLAAPAWPSPLVPVPADRRPRGRRRAARLPGDALLGPGRGRPALHRPERPGRRRALAPGGRAPAEPRPADQPTIEMGWFLEPTDRAAAVAAGRRLMEVARAAPARRRAHPVARPRRPRPGAAHGRDLPPPGRLLPDGPRRRPRGGRGRPPGACAAWRACG